MGRACRAHKGDEKCAKNSGCKQLEGKRQLRIPRIKWKDNINMDYRESRLEDVDWTH
jgi:hypothetical protein